jgi:hypothetical protein
VVDDLAEVPASEEAGYNNPPFRRGIAVARVFGPGVFLRSFRMPRKSRLNRARNLL